VGGSGSNFCQTIIDDSANITFPSSYWSQPFTGRFLPTSPLASFNGQNPNGNWILNVKDLDDSSTGTVYAFSLIITTTNEPTCIPAPPPTKAPTPLPRSIGAVTLTSTQLGCTLTRCQVADWDNPEFSGCHPPEETHVLGYERVSMVNAGGSVIDLAKYYRSRIQNASTFCFARLTKSYLTTSGSSYYANVFSLTNGADIIYDIEAPESFCIKGGPGCAQE
jgi:hypothetical protein